MKKMLLLTMLAVAGSATVFAQSAADKLAADKTQLSLADARGKIDKAVESPAVMKEIMKRLSAADQKQFLADVNKAISDLPASSDEKTAKFLSIDRAAVTAAQKGNTTALIAEVFATASPEALTAIAESFAADLVNRATNPNVTYSDAQFAQIATETMKAINERTAETDNASVRSTFAIIMFVKASNTSNPDLVDKLVETLPNEEAREMAKSEWIPSALGQDGSTKGYEPLLASADAGRRPDYAQVLVIAGPQHLESVLTDIIGKGTDEMAFSNAQTPVLDAIENTLVQQVPTVGADVPGAAGEAGNTAGGATQEMGSQGENPRPTPDKPEPEPDEPNPYWNQSRS